MAIRGIKSIHEIAGSHNNAGTSQSAYALRTRQAELDAAGTTVSLVDHGYDGDPDDETTLLKAGDAMNIHTEYDALGKVVEGGSVVTLGVYEITAVTHDAFTIKTSKMNCHTPESFRDLTNACYFHPLTSFRTGFDPRIRVTRPVRVTPTGRFCPGLRRQRHEVGGRV